MSRVGAVPADNINLCQCNPPQAVNLSLHTNKRPTLEQLLEYNKCWSGQNIIGEDSTCPQKVFWLGCSCASVPPNIVTLSRPGAIMAHRNFGSLFQDNDLSVLADLTRAIEQSVDRLDIAIVTHDDCQAIELAIRVAKGETDISGPIRSWIQPLIDFVAQELKENPNISTPTLAERIAREQKRLMESYLWPDKLQPMQSEVVVWCLTCAPGPSNIR
ncbi:hypothetical protein SCHPADRAFT_368997 [Schizopora paradoxa]|uniref:Carbonic anhydrase n=1 Tax=Schizopora paradoxa TaxID=27342 RepID=A0A0H2RV31_9AGAM|nr:hypothetical protein SCHPADRAFT_368997 [Schizopora paradoxa]